MADLDPPSTVTNLGPGNLSPAAQSNREFFGGASVTLPGNSGGGGGPVDIALLKQQLGLGTAAGLSAEQVVAIVRDAVNGKEF